MRRLRSRRHVHLVPDNTVCGIAGIRLSDPAGLDIAGERLDRMLVRLAHRGRTPAYGRIVRPASCPDIVVWL
jgi:glutamate synthase domain-containing protein 1